MQGVRALRAHVATCLWVVVQHLHALLLSAWCACASCRVLPQTAAIEEEMRQNPATAAILNALHGSRTTARERQTGKKGL